MIDDLAPPTFPPLITGHPVAASGDAFATALAAVEDGTAGAGDLYWSEALNRLDFALVLEPEVKATRALQVHLAVMVAFGDALGATAPPETAVHYRWPGTLLVNGAAAGQVRTALSATPDAETVPAHMVTGLTLAIHPGAATAEPGHQPETTSLWDEGCTDVDRTRLIESIARHTLTWIDTWECEGFGPVHEIWCGRAEGRKGNVTVAGATTPQGGFIGLDEDGNLVVQGEAGARALSLIERIERF
jgi:BirA family transcriptional regulator, biotin operon repressor / biotin---[acetyl-CoA-carboxylase] ligase